MIKKNFIFILFFFYAISMTAQKSYIKIGTGIGTVPYEETPGWNLELQYEYQMMARLSGFLSLGINRDNFTSMGRSQGNDGNETWDNSWQFKYSERFNYIDAGLRYRVFNNEAKRYVMKAVLGASVGQSVFNYPENIFINRGIIEQRNDVTRRVEVGMLLLGIENHVKITDRFGISLNLNYRTTFDKKHILTREVRYHNSLSSSTSGILHVVNVLLQFGYLF